MTAALASLLRDFGPAEPTTRAVPAAQKRTAAAAPLQGRLLQPPRPASSSLAGAERLQADAGARAGVPEGYVSPTDAEAIREEAFRAGHAQATATLSDMHAAERAELLDRHARDLEALDRNTATMLADALPLHLETLRAGLARDLSADIARMIAPFVGDAVATRMVDAFARELADAIAAETRVVVRGSATLFERLAHHEAAAGLRLEHRETASPDLSVEIDGTIVATRLGAWFAAVRETLT